MLGLAGVLEVKCLGFWCVGVGVDLGIVGRVGFVGGEGWLDRVFFYFILDLEEVGRGLG